MREFSAYTAARIGLFLSCFGLLYAGFRVIGGSPVPLLWPLIGAAVISSALSLVLLSGMRSRFQASVQARAERMTRSFDDRRATEDVD